MISDFFGNIADWLDDNLDVAGPVGAFIGVAVALVLGFIYG